MNETFVYHRAVENMEGTTLYPLNQLKTIFPDAYKAHLKKYKDREHLLETKIPTLDCLWNDVLHFTAVSPEVLYRNITNAGFNPEIVWKKWFQIPVSMLDPKNTTVCLYRRDLSLVPDARSFSEFDSSKMAEYGMVLPETLQYYQEQFKQGKRPLFFHRVPHILYKGTVDTTGLEIIKLK